MAFLRVLPLVALAVAYVRAETHTISFKNNCGKGTPQLIVGGKLVSSGEDYTQQGQVPSSIAYLQTGECLFNGENCSTVEMFLGNPNPAEPGSGSSTDISLIPPHAFNVAVGFSYSNGCDNQGTVCNTANCNTAFFHPDDTWVQVACQTNNVNLVIEFCPDGGAAPPPSPSTSNPAPPPTTSQKPPPPPPTSTHTTSSSTVAAPKPTTSSTSVFTPPTTSSAAPSTTPATTTLALKATSAASSAALPSGTPNRKTCKPGQKKRKRSPAAVEAEQAEKRHAAIRAHHHAAHHH